MSKRINVNPDHYKVAGRERQGDAVVKAKGRPSRENEARTRWDRKTGRKRRP
jgi:hypothetical protein